MSQPQNMSAFKSSLNQSPRSASRLGASAQRPLSASRMASPSRAPVASMYKSSNRPMSMRSVEGPKKSNHIIAYVLWFIIVFLLAWIILYAFSPSFVVTSDEVDTTKIILWSVVIALIVVTIVAIVYTEQKGKAKFSLNF